MFWYFFFNLSLEHICNIFHLFGTQLYEVSMHYIAYQEVQLVMK